LAAARLETAEGWAEERSTEDEVRELMGAVAETFVARLRLVCLALPTAYGLRDEVAADRPSPTWKAVGEARLKALGAGLRSLGRARAKALSPRAAQGFACRRLSALFQGLPALRQRSALALGQRLPPAHTPREAAERVLGSHLARTPVTSASLQAQAAGEARRTEGRQGAEGHNTSRYQLAPLALPLPPCTLHDATPQPAAPVYPQFQAGRDALAR
jgi:hypothetical protein